MTFIKGKNVIIKEMTNIGNNVIIEDNVYIDYGVIIRDNVHIKQGSYIGARCIIGEYTSDFFHNMKLNFHPIEIGEKAIIRSETIIYGDCRIGSNFQTGHRATIREGNQIGDNVRIGTLSDIQFNCIIGNYVNMHSNVFLGEKTIVEDYAWLCPGVSITNDQYPPSNCISPVTVKGFATIGAKALILPGIIIGKDTLVGAGSVVTKTVDDDMIVVGNPARIWGKASEIRSKIDGSDAYPWRKRFKRGMPWEEIGYDRWKELKRD